jgi:hypothetical protein
MLRATSDVTFGPLCSSEYENVLRILPEITSAKIIVLCKMCTETTNLNQKVLFMDGHQKFLRNQRQGGILFDIFVFQPKSGLRIKK